MDLEKNSPCGCCGISRRESEGMGGWVVEGKGLAMGISCNPIWDGGDALREILTGTNRETAAETAGNKEAASKH